MLLRMRAVRPTESAGADPAVTPGARRSTARPPALADEAPPGTDAVLILHQGDTAMTGCM